MSVICVISSDLLTPPEHAELLAEAVGHRTYAKRIDRPGWQIVAGQQFLGPARYWYSLDGEAREEVHHRLVKRVADLIHTRVYAIQSNYLYYNEDDFLGLHHDQARCPLTVIALLRGDAEPLCIHKELVGVPAPKLRALVEPGGHQGGEQMSLQEGSLLISGSVVPHHRTPHRGTEPIIIATFCFAQTR